MWATLSSRNIEPLIDLRDLPLARSPVTVWAPTNRRHKLFYVGNIYPGLFSLSHPLYPVNPSIPGCFFSFPFVKSWRWDAGHDKHRSGSFIKGRGRRSDLEAPDRFTGSSTHTCNGLWWCTRRVCEAVTACTQHEFISTQVNPQRQGGKAVCVETSGDNLSLHFWCSLGALDGGKY